MKNRGLSTVITIVLIILASVVILAVFWFGVLPIISQDVFSEEGMTDISIDMRRGYTIWDEDNKSMSVQVEVGKNNGGAVGIQFIFTFEGSSISEIVYDVPGYNQQKVYNFNLTSLGGRPDSVSIAPVFVNEELGKVISTGRNIPKGEVIGELIEVTEEPPRRRGGGGGGGGGTPSTITPIPEEPAPVSTFRDLTENVLVLYNENALDAREVAEYYVGARGINESRLCGVQLPTGQIATKDQLLGARKVIVEECICGIVSEDVIGICNIDNINNISAVSPVSHLAIIKGIPPRLTGTGWSSDSEEPSLDWTLSFMLYKDFNVFDSSLSGSYSSTNYTGVYSDVVDSQPSSSHYNYIRDINNTVDRYLAYGRIEAMDKNRTIDLIDRTIAAENKGFSGNLLFSQRSSTEVFDIFRDLSSSRNNSCEDYIDNAGEEWPYESCRTGSASRNGEIPGESGSKIPQPINAGIYLGDEYDGNGHSAFDGFYNMLNWHKSEYSCTELCEDFADPADEQNCRDNSTDYFKEINTDCVGVADGFIGWQLRSWPVQYYGIWPTGWSHLSGGNGASEKTPPIILSDSGNNYLHYGALDANETPECVMDDGVIVNCSEIIAVNLRQSIDIVPDVLIGSAQQFNLTLTHRNPVNQNGRIRIYLYIYFTDGSYKVTPSQYIYFNEESADWKNESLFFEVTDEEGKTMKSLLLDISSSISSAPEEWLNLDEIQLYDITQDEMVSNLDYGNFDSPYVGAVSSGDYAANVIDRLGGIGWWGSGSHFLTGGWAFSGPQKFAGAFFSGRTLGESLMYDSSNAESAIIYGDPLYNPSGVKIYTGDITSNIGNLLSGYSLDSSDLSEKKIYINAFHGRDNLDSTNWSLSVCNDVDVDACDLNVGWVEIKSDGEAAANLEIREVNVYLAALESDDDVFLRLRVWNDGEEENDITNYGLISYSV